MTEDQSTPEASDEKKPLEFSDDLEKMQFDLIEGLIVKRNELVGKVNAAHGDRVTLTETIRETSEDEKIVEAREEMSKWSEILESLVKPEVDRVIADTAGSVEGFTDEIKIIDGKLKPGMTLFKKLYEDAPSLEHFTQQKRLAGATVRSGSGGRRIRGFSVIITVDGEDRQFDNFTSGAKYLDVDTSDLQAEFFKAAGTEVLKDVPDTVNFNINFDESDGDTTVQKDAMVKAFRDDSDTPADEPDNVVALDGGQQEVEDSDEVNEDVDPFDED